MQIQPIQNQQNFNGKIILVGKISTHQKHLLDWRKYQLERMVAPKPYNIYVKQSRSKNIIFSTYENFEKGYLVRKKEQDFLRVARWTIEDKDRKLAEEFEKSNPLKKGLLILQKYLYLSLHK